MDFIEFKDITKQKRKSSADWLDNSCAPSDEGIQRATANPEDTNETVFYGNFHIPFYHCQLQIDVYMIFLYFRPIPGWAGKR